MEDDYGSGVGAYLELIINYFSFVEVIAIGLMFWASSRASGALFLNFMNIGVLASHSMTSSSSHWILKIYSFLKELLLSTLVFIAICFIMIIFTFYGILATWALSFFVEIIGIKEPVNFVGTSIAMTIAFILGNVVALTKTLSKQIKWLECGNKFSTDYEKRSEKFKNLDSYHVDFKKDEIGRWPKH